MPRTCYLPYQLTPPVPTATITCTALGKQLFLSVCWITLLCHIFVAWLWNDIRNRIETHRHELWTCWLTRLHPATGYIFCFLFIHLIVCFSVFVCSCVVWKCSRNWNCALICTALLHKALKGRERAIVSHTNIGIVSKATLEKLLRDWMELKWAFPSAQIPSWTELNWTEQSVRFNLVCALIYFQNAGGHLCFKHLSQACLSHFLFFLEFHNLFSPALEDLKHGSKERFCNRQDKTMHIVEDDFFIWFFSLWSKRKNRSFFATDSLNLCCSQAKSTFLSLLLTAAI